LKAALTIPLHVSRPIPYSVVHPVGSWVPVSLFSWVCEANTIS
jgi:hypothetical protein